MSSFMCPHCGAGIIDTPRGYVTECEHYPLDTTALRVSYPDHQIRQAAEEVSELSCRMTRQWLPQPLTPDQVEHALRRVLLGAEGDESHE